MKNFPMLPTDFLASTAHVATSEQVHQERIAQIKGWKGRYEAMDGHFFFATSACTINQTNIASVVNSRVYTHAHANTTSVFLPTGGEENMSIVNGERFNWGVNSSGLFAPAGERIGESGERSVLIVDVDLAKMQRMVETMLGKTALISDRLDEPRAIAMTHSNLNFVAMFKHLCQQIDMLNATPALLNFSNLDDQFYRTIALWLFSELLIQTDEPIVKHNLKQLIHKIQQHVHDNLDRTISLTELESLSGLSRRMLQHHFLKQTGKTPLEWVKEEKLFLANEYLLAHGKHEPITDIAMKFGFYSPSHFTTQYKQKYGISPSQALGKK